jgi:hypothetical protein
MDTLESSRTLSDSSKAAPPKQQILLMTATIAPGNARNLLRTDPIARLNDYYDALNFYLGLIDRPLHGIVFAENSSSDVSRLRELVEARGAEERVEFLCNYGSYLYSEEGRAYGEFKLLDHAMTASRMIRDFGSSGVVWKITGRYKVTNLASIIKSAPDSFDAYVDMKNHPRRWLDTRLMGFTTAGYERIFRGVADDLGAKTHEARLRDYVPERAPDAHLVPRFSREPFIDGVRGWDNGNYSKGAQLLKCYVRTVSRVVAPWCWI